MALNRSLDTTALAPQSASPEVLEFNRMLVSGIQGAGWTFPPASLESLRTIALGEPYFNPKAYTLQVPSPDGDIPIRVIPADNPSGIYLHCHPGGWTIGSADGQDASLEAISARTGLTIVSIQYRLAPENPYPAGLNDCETAARWVIENAQAQFGAEKIVIAGESAGANLALCTLLRLKNSGAASSVVGAALLYGNYDLTETPSQRVADTAWMISRESLAWFYDQYHPDTEGRDSPDVSPLYADLAGLPPIVLGIGTADSLVDDTTFLATRMWHAGVECELVVVPGGEHAFDAAPGPAAQAAVEQIRGLVAGFVGR